jgi:threonyl-tRNA synthetase
MPGRLGAKYVGEDNHPHTPVMLHRAICGSLERFVGILIEHYGGAFPLWLAPVQIRVMTVSEKSQTYGEQVTADLRGMGLRVEFDPSSDKIGPKKHAAREQKVPYIVVVGEQEAAEQTLNVNDREGKMLGNFTVEQFVVGLMEEIATKGKGTK